MRIPVVRDGDSTTTGGRVIALKARIQDNGKKIALRGEHATCGNCKGIWEMYGTGDKISNRGMPAVVDGDQVLCPCGKNRVIAGSDAKCFIRKTADAVHAAVTGSTLEVAQLAAYDEQFTLLDDARRALSNVRYRIVTDSGQVFTGTTNAAGQTQRVLTEGSSTLELQLEKH